MRNSHFCNTGRARGRSRNVIRGNAVATATGGITWLLPASLLPQPLPSLLVLQPPPLLLLLLLLRPRLLLLLTAVDAGAAVGAGAASAAVGAGAASAAVGAAGAAAGAVTGTATATDGTLTLEHMWHLHRIR